ncbi:alpha/beta hydrolase [Neiella marina]|uniref:Alpha/beta hydrolase n=1 Tax=Neiella holothuriorum TaxID=2870530 RepID=A0ABS7EK20_9GAMM|nr:alpha/beta hydrolase [Neiella holothuriorum]MBW8192676.1 alpha/beta hydrolase [Neiella holothuriorum]
MPQQHSHFLPYRNGQLHLREIAPSGEQPRQPVLMLHGSMSNGKVFYTESGKGLACLLAQRGHPVYVMDVFGNGQSKPRLTGGEEFGQTEVITEQIPLVHDWIVKRHQQALHWLGHSWGTILLASHLVRFPKRRPQVQTLSGFASKKTIYSNHLKRKFMVNLIWNRFCPMLTRRYGYFPAKRFKLGMDNETTASLLANVEWVNSSQWRDQDGFCYHAASRQFDWPPSWFFAGQGDSVLGNKNDVRAFLRDSDNHNAKLSVLSQHNGNRQDYDHTGLLVHPDAFNDHLPDFADWLAQQEAASESQAN